MNSNVIHTAGRWCGVAQARLSQTSAATKWSWLRNVSSQQRFHLEVHRRCWLSSNAIAGSELAQQRVVSATEDPSWASNETGTGIGHRSTPAQGQPLPWYLQSSAQQDLPTSALDEERLPALPEHPPPILHPRLHDASLDLGLDDLALLDLRRLDPPPALGANVIMAIGTARSEKHLHVSADRLCRWLRTKHRLSPSADGLLGRRELKLKKRRNDRRAKLLGSSGRSAHAGHDDGIRTGWICVNVGRVEPEESQKAERRSRIGVIGFGDSREDVGLVFQIFTEEKRVEYDLEDLWTGQLGRNAQQTPAHEDTSLLDIPKGALLSVSASTKAYQLPKRSLDGSAGSLNFSRRIHTRSRLSDMRALNHQPSNDGPDVAILADGHMSPPRQDPDRPLEALSDSAGPGSICQHGDEQLKSISTTEPKTVLLLRTLLNDLQNRSPAAAMAMLGRDCNDYSSTPFLISFYQNIPPFPTPIHWHYRVELHRHAITLGHPGYSKVSLHNLHRTMQVSGVEILERTFFSMLRVILSRPQKAMGTTVVDTEASIDAVELDLASALEMIEDLSRRGFSAMTEDIFMLFHEAIGFRKPVRNSHAGSRDVLSSPDAEPIDPQCLRRVELQQDRLNFLMDQLSFSFSREENLMRLLTIYANQGRWSHFWDVWRLRPQRMLPRSAEMYICMFDLVARTQHQSYCLRTLRAWLPQMATEEPEVKFQGDVARSVMRCIKWAHPPVEEEAHQVPFVKGEWVRWWRLCEAGTQIKRRVA